MKEGPPKPPSIRKSMQNGNTEHLKRAAHKGGIESGKTRALRALDKAELLRDRQIYSTYADILHEQGEEAADAWLAECLRNE